MKEILKIQWNDKEMIRKKKEKELYEQKFETKEEEKRASNI